MSLTFRLFSYLARRGRTAVWLMIAASLIFLGLVDFLTGLKLSITFFYLLPVALASWALGRRSGVAVALLSTLIMQAVALADPAPIDWLVTLWNFAVRFGVISVVAYLMADLQHLVKHHTELSTTDSLTGLLNRRAFHEAGSTALAAMRRRSAPLTLAFLDIDDFKKVNDVWGHAAGDALLVDAAECLKSQLWGSDMVARLGGDEYCILLPDTNAVAARSVIRRLKATLRRRLHAGAGPVTVSIGVVTCTVPPRDISELLYLADQQMYTAKRSGKDRIEYADYAGYAVAAARPGDQSGQEAEEAPVLQLQ